MNALKPSWHPEHFARRKPFLEARGRVIAAMREYFAARNFAEVETPILQTMPGGEVHLQAFATELKDPYGKIKKLYLHTSPELAMKKLLVAGMPRIYQMARVFRNGEHSSLHHPEFLMCEWYRSQGLGIGGQGTGIQHSAFGIQGSDNHLFEDIKRDCVGLVRAAAKAADRKIFSYNDVQCDPFEEWETLTVAEAFSRYADIDLLVTVGDANLLAKETARGGVRTRKSDTWDDLFFRIMGEKIEPNLGKDRPVFLCDYPVSMAALARPKPNDPRLAERVEFYICGIEMANGFGELTDAGEQQRRMRADMALKKKLYGESWPVDEDFIKALQHGMPPSAGIALGVDRLVMLCAGAECIRDVLWLPVAG